jgi:ABC-type molybdate transport system ATPase subunit
MADDAGAAPLSAEDVQKRERLRSVLTSLIGEVHVKLSHLRYTIETLQSLADIKVRIENGKKKKKKKSKKIKKNLNFSHFIGQ